MPTVTTRIAQTFKKPSIAESYGTFATLQAAMTYVENADIKCAGLTVGIDQLDGSIKEYWLQPVEGQLQFVEKLTAVAGDVVETTYAALKALRDGGNLVPGTWYRITDYHTTVSPLITDVRSADHQFDVIVRADDASHLNENGYAAHHDGDEYFANCKLEAWQLKYSLDNDTERFAWADDTNGTGVVYWMKDEWDNEAPYDFKNIKFSRTLTNGAYDDHGTAAYVYTFNSYSGGTNSDATVLAATNNKIRCCNNVISEYRNTFSGGYKLLLNNIVFLNVYANNTGYTCSGNKFGINCKTNTFGNSCAENTFGNDCGYSTFGNSCSGNSFGNSCGSNSFGNGCGSNSFGNGCAENTFGNSCAENTFGNSCYNNSFGNYCYRIVVSNGAEAFGISTGSDGHPVGSCQVLGANYGGKTLLDIPFVADCNYTQIAGLDNNGSLVIFNPADLVQ